MKNIFKIHFSSYFLYILLILSGYINYLTYYLIIIFFHELGHIIMIKLLKYKIEKIEIYPFGGIIRTNINYNINSNKLFLISISGILMQLLLFLIIPDTNSNNYEIFKLLNYSLIIFNLLPIKPSDGSKVLESFLERIINYRLTQVISIILSIIFLFSLFIFTKNIIIFVILYILNMQIILKFKYLINKFKLERYLYPQKYKKNSYVNSENNIYKCRNNHIKWYNNYIEESDYFQRKFGQYYWQSRIILVSFIMFVSIHYKPH